MPKISVIVPVYKVEPYLRRCIDSILGQTFRDFELILVDDGSPDGCPAICDEYAERDIRIHVIHKENGGLSSARNAGMAVAVGEYLMFCDSDDYVSPYWCLRMVECVEREPLAFYTCDVLKVSSDEKVVFVDNGDIHLNEMGYFDIYKLGLSAYVVNKIYVSDVVKSKGLLFDENSSFAEDVAFNVKYCECCERCYYIDEALYAYVQAEGSIMHRYYRDYFGLHLPIFKVRLPLVRPGEIAEYCDIWLYQFIKLFDNVFDKRNKDGFFKKMSYNQKMLRTEEVRLCLEKASCVKESPPVIRLLKHGNYYLYWLYDKVSKIKRSIGGKTK